MKSFVTGGKWPRWRSGPGHWRMLKFPGGDNVPAFSGGWKKNSLNLQLHKTSVFIYSHGSSSRRSVFTTSGSFVAQCPALIKGAVSLVRLHSNLWLISVGHFSCKIQAFVGLPRTLLETLNTYVFGKSLPKFLWGLLWSHRPNPANLHLLWTLVLARACPSPHLHSAHWPAPCHWYPRHTSTVPTDNWTQYRDQKIMESLPSVNIYITATAFVVQEHYGRGGRKIVGARIP